MLQAMHAAEKAGFLPWTRDPAAFDLEAYQHYEQVCGPCIAAQYTLPCVSAARRCQAGAVTDAVSWCMQVQNGDLNWILPGKLLAFAGPTAVAKVLWGYRTFTPEDYWGYFREHGVSAVVRLNNKVLGPFS